MMFINDPQSKSVITVIFLLFIQFSCSNLETEEEPIIAVDSPESVTHPMDALTGGEMQTLLSVLEKEGHLDENTRFPLINLKEPPKSKVLSWANGAPFGRSAFAMIKQGKQVFEAVVDLQKEEMISWNEKEGVQTTFLMEEMDFATNICKENKDWQEAIKKRGYTSFDDISGQPLSPGYYNIPEEEGLRLIKAAFMDHGGAKNHIFGKPIEGLYAIVDIENKTVLKIIDTGVIPVNTENHDYDEGSVSGKRQQMHAVRNTAPTTNIKRDGNVYSWDLWKFHFRIDSRLGPILSLAKFDDRSVVYQMSISEMQVPYQDPDIGWFYRTFMDVGEYGFGSLATPLLLGKDVPEDAILQDAILPNDRGEATVLSNVAAIFERNTGKPLWRHYEGMNQTQESRPAVELVLRMIPTIGNYDYMVDFIFTQNGNIKVEVGATGIDAVKGVKAQSMDDEGAEEETQYGELIAKGLVGTYHDHFLSFRVDVDIDGSKNSFQRDKLVKTKFPDNVPRLSGWKVEPETKQSEGPVEKVMGQDEFWRIVNPNQKNYLGNNTSYHLRPGMSHLSLLDPEDYPQKRAAFAARHLWVTTYNPDENYAAGMYPNASKGGDGLPNFISDNQSIVNEDIVLWYTMGFHHLTISEDWPILSTMLYSFTLRPFNFFDRNPALDVKAEFKE